MNQENTNEPLSKTAVMQSVLIEEMLQKLKFVLDCNNRAQAERMIEQFIFNQEELTIEFVKWLDKRDFDGKKYEELYDIFKHERLETVA